MATELSCVCVREREREREREIDRQTDRYENRRKEGGGGSGLRSLKASALTSVCSHVGLKGLVSGKHSVADFTSDITFHFGPLHDQIAYGIISWSPSPQVLARVGRLTEGRCWTEINSTRSIAPVPRIHRWVADWRTCWSSRNRGELRYTLIPPWRLKTARSRHL